MLPVVQLQILAYNADLYVNASQALLGTHGLCVITLLAQVRINNYQCFTGTDLINVSICNVTISLY